MEKKLPSNWAEVNMGDFFLIERGGSPRPIKDFITDAEDGINWIKIGDTKGSTKYVTHTKEKIRPEGVKRSRMVYKDDFILSNSMSFGRPYIMKTEGCIHDGWLVIRKNESVDSDFLYYVLSSNVAYSQFVSLAKGSTVKNLNIQAVKKVVIPIAPLAEQKRIVAKLDNLFANLEQVKSRLTKVPQLLKDFRQAVLTQAVTGKLTEEWRSINTFEIEELVNKTETIRRTNWEERTLKELLSKGKDLKNNKWKLKYKKPLELEIRIFKQLPEEWAELAWDQISDWVTYGFTRPMPHTEDGVPIITGKNIHSGKIHFEKHHHTDHESFLSLSDKDRPTKGDLLITKDGSIGRAAIVQTNDPFCINQSVAIAWLRNSLMVRKYLLYVVMSREVQNEIKLHTKGVAIQHLSVTDFRKMQVPVPSVEEQTEIVKRVEGLFSKADAIEEKYNSLKQKIDNLPQAILAKAFKGELVPQLDTDGDAKDLLKEIVALKAEAAVKGKKKGRGK